MQGSVSEVSIDPSIKGKKAGTVVLEAPGGKVSLSIGLCTFVYEEPREAKPVARGEAEPRPFQRSLCSFHQTRSLYATNYVNR